MLLSYLSDFTHERFEESPIGNASVVVCLGSTLRPSRTMVSTFLAILSRLSLGEDRQGVKFFVYSARDSNTFW